MFIGADILCSFICHVANGPSIAMHGEDRISSIVTLLVRLNYLKPVMNTPCQILGHHTSVAYKVDTCGDFVESFAKSISMSVRYFIHLLMNKWK